MQDSTFFRIIFAERNQKTREIDENKKSVMDKRCSADAGGMQQ
jgi:hypothetical protein